MAENPNGGGGDGGDRDRSSEVSEVFSDALDSLTEGFALFDSNHRLVVCNQAARDMSHPLEHLYEPGVSREHIIRQEAKLGGYVDAAGREEDWIAQHLDTGTHFKQNIKMERSNGSCYLVSTYPTKLGGLVVTSRDITETKRIEVEKRQSDDLVRMVLETSASAVLMTRLEDGEIVYRSPAAREMYGVHKSAVSHFVDPEDRKRYRDAVLQTGSVDDFQARYRRANGEIFIASNSGRLAEYRGEKVIVSNVTDITKQLEADELIRTVLDTSSAIISMVSLDDGRILYRTPAAQKLFGGAKTALESYAEPSERDDFLKQLKERGRLEDYKVEFINGEGKKVPVSLSSRIIEYKDEQVIVTSLIDLTEQLKADAKIRKVLEACPVPVQMTRVETGELLFRSPETEALFGKTSSAKRYYENIDDRDAYVRELLKKGWLNDFKLRFIGAEGRPFWGTVSARLIEFNGEDVIVSNTRDLTHDLAMEDELSSQREMLFQNEKMSALGELLAGVAHELNNPLSIVVGHSLMLREEEQEPETVRRIEKISSAAERCAKIVKTFLAMARQQPAKMEPTDINAIVSTAVDVAGYGKANETLTINCDLDDQISEILADGDQITQVIINLLINAEQAIAKAGVGDLITVSTQLEVPDRTIQISVVDNGPGIPEDIGARVFEPFFTTKDVGEGTGIGLAFCHRVVLSHGGQLSLDNSHKQGCKFVVTLPLVSGDEAQLTTIDEPVLTPKSRNVLVVDDEVDVAELIAEILEKEGMTVRIVHSVAEAIEKLKTGEYDLIFSDLNMPQMGGREFYENIKRDFPHMLTATAFISGDTMGASSQELIQESGCPCLEKPIAPAELRRLAKAILESRSDGA
ncbi:MAG: PAS domain-containing protein [Rhizobiaceae bacterium]